ncbi:Methyltransferase type 12 [Candidatus Pelagibacterales bacterium]
MKIIGKPDDNKFKLKNLILSLDIDGKYLKSDLNFRNEIIDKIQNNMRVLDIGKSMRGEFKKIKCKEIKTLDINIFEDYPDFQLDLSEEVEIEKTELYERFDVIICLAVLEHVYNPFIAIRNIKKMLTHNGMIYGYVPFLYHYHAPQDLYFQDYYRYSKDGLAYLLKDFKNVKIYPVRGRLSSAKHILFGSIWKKTFEKIKFNLFLDSFFSKNKNTMQVGGYNFIASNEKYEID